MFNRGLVRLCALGCAVLCLVTGVFFTLAMIEMIQNLNDVIRQTNSDFASYFISQIVFRALIIVSLLIVILRVLRALLKGETKREESFISLEFLFYVFGIFSFVLGIVFMREVPTGFAVWFQVVLYVIGVISFFVYKLHILGGILESLLLCGLAGIGFIIYLITFISAGYFAFVYFFAMLTFLGFVVYYGLDMLIPDNSEE